MQEELAEALKSKDKTSITTVINKIDAAFSPEEIPSKDRAKLEKIRNLVGKKQSKGGMRNGWLVYEQNSLYITFTGGCIKFLLFKSVWC